MTSLNLYWDETAAAEEEEEEEGAAISRAGKKWESTVRT